MWSPGEFSTAGGTRTHTPFRAAVFETALYANSSTAACLWTRICASQSGGLGSRLVRRQLDLDVPLLLETPHGEGDQEQLHRDDDRRQQAEHRRVEPRIGEAGLVALEPGGRRDGGDDSEQDRERGGHRQHAA